MTQNKKLSRISGAVHLVNFCLVRCRGLFTCLCLSLPGDLVKRLNTPSQLHWNLKQCLYAQNIIMGWVVVLVAAMGMCMIYGIRHYIQRFFPAHPGGVRLEPGRNRGHVFHHHIDPTGIMAIFAGTPGFPAINHKGAHGVRPAIHLRGDRCLPHCATSFGIFYVILRGAGAHRHVILRLAAFGTRPWPTGSPGAEEPPSAWPRRARELSYTLGLIMAPIISDYGWRTGYVVQAALVLGVTMPLYLFFFRYPPQTRGIARRGRCRASKHGQEDHDRLDLVRGASLKAHLAHVFELLFILGLQHVFTAGPSGAVRHRPGLYFHSGGLVFSPCSDS